MEAAKKAVLNVQYFISEPTAAATYYSTDTKLSGHYLIYDFGGGTFDVTIINANGSDIEVVWTECVQQLGGKDLDAELLKIIGAKFKAKTGAEFDPVDCNLTKWQTEEIKQALTVREKTRVCLLTSTHGPFAMEVNREEFEAAISYLLTQAEIACETALNNAKLAKTDIREVFMAGDSSRIPATQFSVERFFGKKPLIRNPERAAALGAALYAAQRLSQVEALTAMQREALAERNVTDIAPSYLGIIVFDSNGDRRVEILVDKGERVPCKVTRTYHTSGTGQQDLSLSITQSASEENNPDFVSIIREWNIPIAPGPAGRPIRISIGYDANGVVIGGIDPPETTEAADVPIKSLIIPSPHSRSPLEFPSEKD
jgi:molecular chaperone DnaK